MSKRSRYYNVFFVNGNIKMHSAGRTYHLKDITEWESFEAQSLLNSEEVKYCLTLIGTDYNMVVVCADESECNNIIDELIEQGIGKRI